MAFLCLHFGNLYKQGIKLTWHKNNLVHLDGGTHVAFWIKFVILTLTSWKNYQYPLFLFDIFWVSSQHFEWVGKLTASVTAGESREWLHPSSILSPFVQRKVMLWFPCSAIHLYRHCCRGCRESSQCFSHTTPLRDHIFPWRRGGSSAGPLHALTPSISFDLSSRRLWGSLEKMFTESPPGT